MRQRRAGSRKWDEYLHQARQISRIQKNRHVPAVPALPGNFAPWRRRIGGSEAGVAECLSHRFRGCAAGAAAGEQAAAEEGTFQRTVAVHAAAAEAGGFAGGIKPRHDLTVIAEHARVEVGLEA